MIDGIPVAVRGGHALVIDADNKGNRLVFRDGSWAATALQPEDIVFAQQTRVDAGYLRYKERMAEQENLDAWGTQLTAILDSNTALAAQLVEYVPAIESFYRLKQPALCVAYLNKVKPEIVAAHPAAEALVDELIAAADGAANC